MRTVGAIFRRNPFILALAGGVLLAFLVPGLGAKDGPLQAGVVSKLGVMVIFFLQGLSLKTRELARGLRDIRIHAFVQAWIFIFSAAILAATGLLLKTLSQDGLAEGFFYLALIPTTVASAVAFTSATQGNVAAAIFNTTFSNVFGVFWVPAGCLILFATGGGLQLELLGPLLLNLTWLILLPLATGQALRPFVHRRAWFGRLSPGFKYINHGIILFIVFATFAQSVLNETWSDVATGSILLLLLLTVLAVLLIHAGVWISSGWVLHNRADRKAALFCGAQKTLAAGTPMAVAIFSGNDQLAGVNVSLILLPLLCYHPAQLFLAALVLPRLQD